MRRLLIRLLDRYCAECGRFVWPGQKRCGQRHTNCKHLADMATWERNDYRVTPWVCTYCGRRITELA